MAHSETTRQREMDSMRVLLDKCVDGVCAFDREYRYTYWNAALEQLTGIRREQAVGRIAFELFPISVYSEERFLADILAGQDVELKNQLLKVPGSRDAVYYDLVGSPLFDADGTVYGGSFVVHDITERKRVEEALRVSNERVFNILETITDAFITLDQEWKFVYVNQEAARLLQRERTALIGRNIWEEFPESVGTRFYEQYHKAAAEGVAVEFNAYCLQLSKWFAVRSFPCKNGLSVYFRDITDRQLALEESVAQYRTLFEQNTDAVYSLDLQGRFLSANKASELLSGYTQAELLNQTFQPLILARNLEQTVDHFQKAAQGFPQTFEAIIVHRDGHHVDLQVINIPIIAEGQIVGVYGMAKDITERKRTEEELRRTKEQLESFIQDNADAIWVVDFAENIQRCNPAFADIFGWTEAELLGKKLPIIPDFLATEIQALHERVKKGESISGYQTQRLRKDGKLTYVSATLSPIYDKHGNVVGMTGTCRDISESKKTEEMLLKSEKLAVAGQLAAGVAHEIRNPLTALKGFVQLMQFEENSYSRYLQVMESELNRIELIISELLVLAKPQAITFKHKDVVEILSDVVTISEAQAILNNVQIVCEFEPDIPSLDCDENQLKQVFINFFKNSIEAMQKGGQITLQAKRQDEQHVLIRFIDQGVGIPQEIMARLGEPFYTTKEKGTGLGLMVSHKIIENHHGKILINSKVNVGTTIDVLLPTGSSQ